MTNLFYEFTDWANYFIIIGIFIFSIVIGIFFILKSKETKVVILGYTGIISICIGLMFLGFTTENPLYSMSLK